MLTRYTMTYPKPSSAKWPLIVGALLLSTTSLPTLATPQSEGDHLRKAIQYENGRGVARDPQRAYRLYCLAATKQNADAYYHLGWMYLSGRGVSKDLAIAAGWFAKGADAGDRVSTNNLRRLAGIEPKLDPNCPAIDGPLDRPSIEKLVHLLAPEYDLDPRLVLAVIRAESAFNPKARSHKGAIGLMQLMPATAKRFGVHDIRDPVQNLRGGMAYLQWLSSHFNGDLPLVLAGYNAGENAVERHNGVPPYRETRHYVKRITREYRKVSLAPKGLRKASRTL